MKKNIDINKTAIVSLFSALIIAGTFIKITVVPPVPITLQTLFIYLAALLLGPVLGSLSVFVYLILGLAGLPVFTGGGGPAALLGPTGGFLMAMLPASAVIGILGHNRKQTFSLFRVIIALVVGTAIIYAGGVSWFAHTTEHTIAESLKFTCYPFLIGDAIKMVFATVLAKRFLPAIKDRLDSE